MATLATLAVKLTADTAVFHRNMKGAERAVGAISQRARALRGSLNSAATAAVALGGAFAAARIGRELLRAFEAQQEAVETLRAALEATGRTGEASLQILVDRAGELQRVTTSADEALIQATATVAQLAKGLDVAELAAAQTALIGIADTFTRGDLQTAAQLLGKTIGSTTNALTRYGIQVTSGASQSVKLAEVLQQTATFFEVAQARANTVRGSYQQLRNAVGDLKEELGGILVVAIQLSEQQRGMTAQTFAWIDAIKENRTEIAAWAQVAVRSAAFIGQVLLSVFRLAFNLGQVIGNFVRGTFALVGAAASELFNNLIAGPINALLAAIDMIPGVDIPVRIAGAPTDVFWRDFREQTVTLERNLLDMVDAVTDVAGAWDKVRRAAERAYEAQGAAAAVAGAAGRGPAGVGAGALEILPPAMGMMPELRPGLMEIGLEPVAESAGTMMGETMGQTMYGALLPQMKMIGASAATQLIDAFMNQTFDLADFMKNMFAALFQRVIFSALGIFSPSRLGVEAGQRLAQGVALGFANMRRQLQSTIAVTSMAMPAAAPSVAAVAPAFGSAGLSQAPVRLVLPGSLRIEFDGTTLPRPRNPALRAMEPEVLRFMYHVLRHLRVVGGL